jgi:hypothetical protein
MLIVILVFEKNANFFAENCQKSQKIVIITSTPGGLVYWCLRRRLDIIGSKIESGWVWVKVYIER